MRSNLKRVVARLIVADAFTHTLPYEVRYAVRRTGRQG